ncbi:uncharacterized protein [Leuresthes tenuis]|uniref:uncharacterized protein n=1 Tax=Leuresthes tenuis TaxID=355514 RepID=UPI003B515434
MATAYFSNFPVAPSSIVDDPLVLSDLRQCKIKEGAEFLEWVSQYVFTHKHKHLALKYPPGAILKIAGLEDTIYRAKQEEVNGWGKFYLPDIVNMQVLGVVEGTSCLCDQLVLMTCEDKKLYAYDGDELHEVASSLEQLCNKKITYPADKSYYNGEAFQDMDEGDWAEVKKGEVGESLEQEHRKLTEEHKSTFLQNLKSQK